MSSFSYPSFRAVMLTAVWKAQACEGPKPPPLLTSTLAKDNGHVRTMATALTPHPPTGGCVGRPLCSEDRFFYSDNIDPNTPRFRLDCSSFAAALRCVDSFHQRGGLGDERITLIHPVEATNERFCRCGVAVMDRWLKLQLMDWKGAAVVA